MEDNIRDQLHWKCLQLSEGKSVRCMNALNSLFKEDNERLKPLLLGKTTAMNIPKCGKKTAAEVEEVMNDALYECMEAYKEHWGQKLLNGMRALHVIDMQK